MLPYERGEGERTADHGLCCLERRIGCIDIAEVNLALVRGRCAVQQDFIAIVQHDVTAARGQQQGDAASLETAAENRGTKRAQGRPLEMEELEQRCCYHIRRHAALDGD